MGSTIRFKLMVAVGLLIGVCAAVAAINYVIIKNTGKPVPVPDIPRGPEAFGSQSGRSLAYAVLGDSTAIAQGADYDSGYARATARFLAAGGYSVTLENFGVSGARARDVADKQAGPAAKKRPDLVLIAIGANDVTHLTNIQSLGRDMVLAIDRLSANNPDVRIVLTGAPQMGAVPRLPQPARFLAGRRTAQVNREIFRVAMKKNVLFAHIADETGHIFAKHPEYYAADKFHPNAMGYQTWVPVLNKAIRQALSVK